MLTTREAADRLGIAPRSVAWLIRGKKIAAIWNDYARRYEIEESEVERYQRERLPQHRPPRTPASPRKAGRPKESQGG